MNFSDYPNVDEGTRLLVKKGTAVHSMLSGRWEPADKSYYITVACNSGTADDEITWVGTGKYWMRAKKEDFDELRNY